MADPGARRGVSPPKQHDVSQPRAVQAFDAGVGASDVEGAGVGASDMGGTEVGGAAGAGRAGPARADVAQAPDGTGSAPAYYARQGGPWAQWWTVLHPPYTVWHLSYVAIGAGLAPTVHWGVLGATLLAFFLAVGVAAHALDEVNDRPLRTVIPDRVLWGVAVVCLAGAVGLGVATVAFAGPVLVVFIVLGVGLVLGYNLELFGGLVHTDVGFAAAWGSFPVAVGFVAQAPPLTGPAVWSAAAAVCAAGGLSYAQRCLSTPARAIRRRTRSVEGTVVGADGTRVTLNDTVLLAPLERTLRALSWAVPLLAGAIVLPHLDG